MALTQTQKTDAYQFFIIAFGVAPGVEYMNQLNDAYGAGMTTKQIVNVYTTKPQFEAQYPRFLTNEQFADRLVNNVVGASATDEAKVEAKADVVAALNAGWSKGDVVYQIFTNLAAKIGDATWGGTAQMLANKVEVASYVTETLLVNVTDLAQLGSYVANVTQDVATVDAAKAAALNGSGPSLVLTSGTDALSGAGTFTAGQVYVPGGNDRINSLQDEDSITGTGTADVLNVVLGNTNDNGSGLITPTLNGIETLNVSFSNTDGTGLDLQDATGLNAVNVTRVSSALADGGVATIGGAAVRLLNMPNSSVAVNIANSVAYSDVALTYRNSEIGGNETVTVGLEGAAIETLAVGAQALNTNHINTITLDVNGASHVQNLNVAGGSVETADQTLDIQSGEAGSTFILGADANSNGNYLDDNSALVNSGRLATINITEGANVTLGSVSTRAAGMTLSAGTATGNIAVNITNADGIGASAFTTGSGNDTVVSNGLLGDVVTNAGADTVTVTGDVQVNVAQGAFGSITTGAGADTVTVTGNLQGDVAGGATVSTGDDADTITIGAVPAATIDSDADGDVDGIISNAATLAAARGQGNLGEEAVIDAGAGNDTVTLTGTTAGDTGGGLDGDVLGAQILLGDGDDNLVFDLTNQGAVGTLIGGTVDGGAGANTLTVRGNASVAAVAAVAAADADRVINVQTLNLVSTQAIDEELHAAIEAVRVNAPVPHAVNDGDDDNGGGNTVTGGEISNAETADYTVDVSEFTGLTAINLDNQAGVLNATPEEAVAANRFEGDAATYNIANLTGAESITLSTVEALDSNANFDRAVLAAATTDDNVADATVNMSRATLGAVAVTLNAGVDGTAGDVTLNDTGVFNATPALNTAFISDLTVTVNAAANRTLDLSDDFQNSTVLNGDVAAGRTLRVVNAVSQTFTSTVAANINADFDASKNFTITTAGGNDVVDLRDDTVNGSDTINLGAGTDRIIVNDDLRGNTGIDADEFFNGYTSIEELEFRGDGTPTQFTLGAAGVMEVTLDDDAFATGVNRLVVATIRNAGLDTFANVDVNLGADFERALTVDVQAGSDITIDNDADQALTVNVFSTDAESDNVIAFTDAGLANVVVNVTIDDVAQTIADAGTPASNDVVITNLDATAEIDSIILLDSNKISATDITPAGNQLVAGEDQTGVITLTLGAAWAQAADTLVVNASDINDDDRTDGGVLTNTDNQSLVINAAAANYKVNITGSQVVDTITGTNLADTIDGQAGNDRIIGALGSDVLTGGAGADTFVYTAVAQSDGNTTSTDSITDFASGTDKVELTINDAVNTTFNLGTFAVVNSSGDGDNSLQGINPVRVVGDGFYDAGADKLIIDVDGDGDITTTNDYQITSAGGIAAADVNFVINATNAGGVVVRGGQGADQITTGAGNDTIVMVGNLTAADVNAYVAAGNAAAVGIAGAIANVLTYSELTATNGSANEARTGEVINGGAGADNLHVFGTANLAGMTLNNIETLTVHSTVTLTLAQLYSLQNIVLDGNTPHSIVITGNAGQALTAAEQQAALSALPGGITLVGSGASTTVSVGGTTLVAAGTAVNGALAVSAASQPAGVLTGPVLANADNSGSTADLITNVTTDVDFSGTVAADATVTLFDDADGDSVHDASETAITVTADALGAYATGAGFTFADGTHNVRAYVTAANGLRSDVSAATSVVVDTAAVAPTIALTTDSGSSNSDRISTSAALTTTGAEVGATVEYNVNGAGWVNAAGYTTATTADGAYSVTVRQTDVAGNVSAASAALTITKDTTVAAPTIALTTDSGSSNSDRVSTSAALTTTGAEVGATVEYNVNGAGWVNAAGYTTATTADGAYSVTVRQTDVAGNVSAASAALTITKDTTVAAPTIALTTDSGPSNTDRITNSAALTVGAEVGATVQYSLNNGATWLNAAAYTTATTADGSYNVVARQTDAAGNVSGESSILSFTKDTTVAAPTIALTTDSGSSNSDRVSTSAALTTTGAEVGATVEYNVNGAGWVNAAGYTTATTADGAYSVTVRQTDVAGNVSAASAALTITKDTTVAAPTIALTTDSGSSNSDRVSTSAALTTTGAEVGATVEYNVNGAGWVNAAGYTTATTADGAYSVTVRQTDVAGNVSAASAALTITKDTTVAAPTIALTTDSGSSNSDRVSTSAALTTTGAEVGATVEYNVNGAGWVNAAGYTTATTADGAYSVTVRQTDVAGNVSAASAALTITKDTTVAAPTIALTTDSGSSNSDRVSTSAALTTTGAEVGATVEYNVNGAGWVNAAGYTTATTADGAYSVTVRQTDVAGNVSAASAALNITKDTAAPVINGAFVETSSVASNNYIFQFGETVSLANLGGIHLYVNGLQVSVASATVGGLGNDTVTLVTSYDILAGDIVDVALDAGAFVDVAGNQVALVGIAAAPDAATAA